MFSPGVPSIKDMEQLEQAKTRAMKLLRGLEHKRVRAVQPGEEKVV